MNFTKGQEIALQIMESGRNVFITGEAGTGKSFVVQEYINRSIDDGKNVLVAAPTGTAADNLGGMTIHRAFGAPIGVIADKAPTKRDEVLECVDIIIIDEISMCRFDLFNYVSQLVEYENGERARERFQAELGALDSAKEDIQLIVMGDFFQLPPVMTSDDWNALLKIYPYDFGKGYAFKSPHWDTFGFEYIMLTENIRQEDQAFKTILNRIRISKDKRLCCSWLMEQSSDFPFDDDAIYLSSTNKDVNNINMNKLNALPEQEVIFHAECTGDIKPSEKFAEDELHLKEGCKVMFTVNDPESRFVNGTIGTVERIRDEIEVYIPSKDIHVAIAKITKEIIRPKVVEKEKTVKKIDKDGNVVSAKELVKCLEDDVVGSFTQFPLRLAYAITIHKSQGKTFEKMNMNPYCWDEGQFYTGISRCKKIENICFIQTVRPKFIVSSDEVIRRFS